MRRNEYWFYEREDGEWINFQLADFDEEMKTAGCYFVDEDMRLQRLGIHKNLRDRLQKVTFWQKYGGMIMSIAFILVVTICFVVLFNKMYNMYHNAGIMATEVKTMAQAVHNLATHQGSGMVPVGQ